MNRKLKQENDEITNPAVQQTTVVCPKHLELPKYCSNNEILNEFVIFVFTSISGLCQFLHLYRSVWWPKHSYNIATVHFYLIGKFMDK